MIEGKRVLAIIPARGGSKGVPGKNIRLLAGKPLIAWTIERAKQSKYIDRLIVSTDDQVIADVAMRYGCEAPFLRPAELAQDDTPGVLTVLHVLEEIEGYDYTLLLQPTSPLRTADDMDACMEHGFHHGAKSCVSVTEPDKSPYWMYTLASQGELRPLLERPFITRRQMLPPVFALNGALYFNEVNWLQTHRSFIGDGTIGFVMPKERSWDIDTEDDFEICEYLLRRSLNQSLNRDG